MARLYESSTDYEEHITYAGETVADDYDNPDYAYDRPIVAYDGGTTNIQAGYASTAITYNSAVTGWNGSKTVTETGTGTGTGTSTTTSVRIVLRDSTGTGAGTSTAARTVVRLRTATGAGVGASNNTIVHKQLRTGFGAGGATAGDTATWLRTVLRTATGTGVGGSVPALSSRVFRRVATGINTSDGTAEWNRLFLFRTPTDLEVDFTGAYRVQLVTQRQRAAFNLYRFYEPGPRGRNLWKLTDGTYTENQPAENDNIDIVYYGGHNHHVDDVEKAELVAAGYGEYVN